MTWHAHMSLSVAYRKFPTAENLKKISVDVIEQVKPGPGRSMCGAEVRDCPN